MPCGSRPALIPRVGLRSRASCRCVDGASKLPSREAETLCAADPAVTDHQPLPLFEPVALGGGLLDGRAEEPHCAFAFRLAFMHRTVRTGAKLFVGEPVLGIEAYPDRGGGKDPEAFDEEGLLEASQDPVEIERNILARADRCQQQDFVAVHAALIEAAAADLPTPVAPAIERCLVSR